VNVNSWTWYHLFLFQSRSCGVTAVDTKFRQWRRHSRRARHGEWRWRHVMTCCSHVPLVWTFATVDGSRITQRDLLSARSNRPVDLEMIMSSTRALMLLLESLLTPTANVNSFKNVNYITSLTPMVLFHGLMCLTNFDNKQYVAWDQHTATCITFWSSYKIVWNCCPWTFKYILHCHITWKSGYLIMFLFTPICFETCTELWRLC